MSVVLNEIDVKSFNVKNTFLSAPCKEKLYITAGKEFGVAQSKLFITVQVSYGIKSASASFHVFMAEYFDELDFKSCDTDNDVWMRRATKEIGFEFYEYVIMYIDDILVMSNKATEVLNQIGKMPRV